MEFLIGAAGALVTVALLVCGTVAGWVLRGKFDGGSKGIPPVAEAERKRMIEDQRAFQQQMNYNVNMAYGMDDFREGDGV